MSTELPSHRILPIDTFRGITILVMIFVNELSGIRDIPQWARHMPADVDAMTFVDADFPAFLFIVGMAMPFAIQTRRSRGAGLFDVLSHGLVRSIGLIIIGVFKVNTTSGFDADKMPRQIHAWALLMYLCVMLVWAQYPERVSSNRTRIFKATGAVGLTTLWWIFAGVDYRGMTSQWWGILGLIGWAYVMTLPIYLISRRVSVLSLAALAYLAAFATLGRVGGSDTFILGWLIENKGITTHATIMLAGIILSLLMYHRDHAARFLRNALIYTPVVVVLAVASWQVFPISKIWATPTWSLFSIVVCAIQFLMLDWVIEQQRKTRWTRLVEPAASNALMIYIVPFVLAALFGVLAWSPRPELFDAGMPGAVWSLLFAIAVMFIGSVLSDAGIRLKL